MRRPAAPTGGARVAAVFALAFAAATPNASAGPPKEKTASPSSQRHTVSRGRFLMGTVCTVTAEGADTAYVAQAIERAFEEVARLETALSSWRDDSELAAVNRGPSQTRIAVSAPFYETLEHSLGISEETDGAFDPTIEPLNRAWDMRGQGRLPSPQELTEARSRVGWRRVRIEPTMRTVWFQRDSMALDFGGIGKGVALDHMEAVLRAAAVKRALINFGGEALAMSDAAGWSIKVAHPAERMTPAVNLAVHTCAVSTSGQLERGVDVRGAHYGHVLDPARGVPVETEASVTVVTRSAARADGLSTALLVMGRVAAERFAGEHPELGVLWLEPAGRGVRGWRWNLPTATATGGTRVEWVN